MNNHILAVVGLPGAGKSESVEYILQRTSWGLVHFGNTVVDEVRKRGLEINQVNERIVREEFRARHGMAALALLNLPKMDELLKVSHIVLDGVYSWEEYLLIKEKYDRNFHVLAVIANFHIRASRLAKRTIRPLTREELELRDRVQIETLHQAGPIVKADYTVINEESQLDLHHALDGVLANIVTLINNDLAA
jgi:dephospho-CoA kinase